MRKIVTFLAASSALLAVPAFARDGAWYVGGEFGAMIVEDMDVDIGATEDAITLNHEYGYDGGLFVGYDLGAFRLEGEVAYKTADLEGFQTLIRLPGEGAIFPAERDFAGGSTSALSFMLNGMLDFGDDDGTSGFIGAGGGIARVKYNDLRVFENTAPFLDDSDSKFAWQVFGGVRQAISDNVDVTVKYRFFNVGKLGMVAFNGAEADSRFRSHSLLGGITFNFGGAEPPPPPPVVAPPPPPPPPPPPAVQTRVCPTGVTLPVTQPCPVPPPPVVAPAGERG